MHINVLLESMVVQNVTAICNHKIGPRVIVKKPSALQTYESPFWTKFHLE